MDWIDRKRRKREMEALSKYGPISPRTDRRCFRREMVEELLDALNYCQWAREKGEVRRRDWKIMDANMRFVIGLIGRTCQSMKAPPAGR
jgi:hypothetical protein